MTLVSAVPELSRVYIDGSVYLVKSARVRATASGNTQIVAAVTGSKIRPLAWTVGPASAAVVVTIQDAAGTPVVLAGPFDCAANGGIVNSTYKESDQEGTVSVAVNVNLSATANCTVHMWFVEVVA